MVWHVVTLFGPTKPGQIHSPANSHSRFTCKALYPQSTPEPNQALLLITGELVQRTLNTLHLHGFHTYLTRLQPEILRPVFTPIFKSLSPYERERYREIVTSEPIEPVIEVSLNPIPIPPPTIPSSISSPSSITPSLALCLSSRPASPTDTLVPEYGFSGKCPPPQRLHPTNPAGPMNHLVPYANPAQD